MNYFNNSPNVRDDRLVGVFFGLGLLLAQFYTAPLFSNSPIRFSDLGAALIFLACILRGGRPPTVVFLCKAMAFIAWLILVFFAVDLLIQPIDAFNHFINAFRVVAGLILVGALNFGLKKSSSNTILAAINFVLIFHLVLFFLYVTLFSVDSLRGLFKVVTPGDERNALIAENNLLSNHLRIIIAEGDVFRFSGIFEEPAFFSWNIIALAACSLQISKNTGRRLNVFFIFFAIACTTMFSRSFSGMLGILLLSIPVIWRGSMVKTIVATLGIVLMLVGLFFLADQSLRDRVELLLILEDGSSNSRIIGSFNAFVGMLENSPVYGFGLGDRNKEFALKYIEAAGISSGFDPLGVLIMDIHNGIVQVGFSLGLFGLFLYFLLLWPSFRAGKFYAIGMVIVFCSSNVFNAYFVWAFIGLGAYAARLSMPVRGSSATAI